VVNGLVPNIDTSDNSFIESEKHLNGINENEVWYYKVVGGGHDWPGAWGNMDIEAGEEAWLFFQNYIDANLLNTNLSTIEKSIHIFPNPSNYLIKIEILESIEILETNLYNTLGVNQKIKLSDENMDLSSLKSGIYILVIKTLEGIITKKIIKN